VLLLTKGRAGRPAGPAARKLSVTDGPPLGKGSPLRAPRDARRRGARQKGKEARWVETERDTSGAALERDAPCRRRATNRGATGRKIGRLAGVKGT